MKTNGRSLFRLGLKRRKKDVRRMRLMMCIAVFFLSFPFLFQDNMNGYQMMLNYRIFGRWFACSEYQTLGSTPYLEENGFIERGSKVYNLWSGKTNFRILTPQGSGSGEQDEPPETINTSFINPSRDPVTFIGALSPGMAEQNGIEILDGRFPEKDGEVAVEVSVLDELGLSHELGSEVSFYISPFDDYDLFNYLYQQYIAEVRGEQWEDEAGAPHYDYNLDDIPSVNELYRVRFKLVGTIQRYSTRWNTEMVSGGSANLPGVIMSQQGFDRTAMSKRTYRFFDLKPEYNTQDVWRFAGELMDSVAGDEADTNKDFVLNRFAYDNPLWGNASMYRSITILLIVISTCIIAYLMANYLGKRRQFFMRMREIGASTRDVWKMAAYECVGSVLPGAALTLAAAYLLSFLVVFLVVQRMDVESFYVFSLRTLLTILFSVGLTLGVSLLAALVLFGGRSLVAKTKVLSHAALKRLKKRAQPKQAHGEKAASVQKHSASTAEADASTPSQAGRTKRYLGLLEALKRERLSNRFKSRVLTVISILVCAIILFCATKVYKPAKAYWELSKIDYDFSGEIKRNIRNVRTHVPIPPQWDGHMWHYSTPAEWTMTGFSCRSFIPAKIVQRIDAMPGVREIDWRDSDFTHMITFAGKDEDPFFQTYLDTFVRNNQPYCREVELELTHSFAPTFIRAMERDLYGIRCKLNAEEFWKQYEPFLDSTVADYDAFLRGEQIIAVVDTEMMRARQWQPYGEDAYPPDSDALKVPEMGPNEDGGWYGYAASFSPGDTLTVLCRDDHTVDVTVAGVVPYSESGLGADDARFLTLLGADAFMLRIARADSNEVFLFGQFEELGYNEFVADLDAVSANEFLVKDMVNICADNDVQFRNIIAEREVCRDEMVNAAVTYGFFGLMLAVLFFFITSCIAKDEEIGFGEKYRILNRFGMTVSRMKTEKRLDALRRTLPLILAFPAQLLLQFLSNSSSYLEQVRLWADQYAHTSHPASNPALDTPPLLYALKLPWNDASPALTVLLLGVMALIYWGIISRMDKEWRKTL